MKKLIWQRRKSLSFTALLLRSLQNELGWNITDGVVDCFFVAYTVSGRILEFDKYEVDIQDEDLF